MNRFRTLHGITVACVVLAAMLPATVAAQQQQNANLYAYFTFTGGPFQQNLDQELLIRQKAAASYWAMIWRYPGNPNGAYMGLQTDGNRLDGTTGDTAIFSIWGAKKADGPGCGAFGGEGTGLSCRLAYPIAINHWYRLRTWKVSADKSGVWWGAWVMDETTQQESYIGRLLVGAGQTSMSGHANFSEYYGAPVPTIQQVPRSVVLWSTPSADLAPDGSYRFNAAFSSSTKGDGTTGSVTGNLAVHTPGKHTQAVRITQGG